VTTFVGVVVAHHNPPGPEIGDLGLTPGRAKVPPRELRSAGVLGTFGRLIRGKTCSYRELSGW
jgi:hypothetical protein